MVHKDITFNGDTIPINEFKLDDMVINPSICMIAKRGSGKSWVCRDILNHFSDIPGGVIIAPTDRMNCFYGKFFPNTYINYKFKSETINKLLCRQDEIIEKTKKKYKEGKRCDPRAFLLMDDCLSSKGKWAKDETILKLLFDGRHYQIMYILTMQFPLGIQPELRGNFDYVFLLADDNYNNQKRIYDHYAGMFPSFNAFRQVFVDLTSDYGCMVIVNRGARNNISDKIFWYKANKPSIKKIGSRQFNEFHDNNYDKKWREKEKKFNYEEFESNKGKSRIKVNKISHY